MTDRTETFLKKTAADASFAVKGESMGSCPPFFACGDAPFMPTEDSANTRRDQALDWLMRVQQAPLDADLRGQVADWCAASEANAKAYRQAERVWQLTGQVAPVEPIPQPAAPMPRPAARPRRVHRQADAGVALAAAAAHQLCQAAQHLVADLVPMVVIDLFEMVDVQHDGRKGAAFGFQQ